MCQASTYKRDPTEIVRNSSDQLQTSEVAHGDNPPSLWLRLLKCPKNGAAENTRHCTPGSCLPPPLYSRRLRRRGRTFCPGRGPLPTRVQNAKLTFVFSASSLRPRNAAG